ERTPMTMNRILELVAEAGLPAGVVNLVDGSRDPVQGISDHSGIRALSFLRSTAVARAVYERAAANGKRAQCQGGARNPVVVLPDADLDMTCRIIADSDIGRASC